MSRANILRNIQNIVGSRDKENKIAARIVFCINCGLQVFDTASGQPIKCQNCGHVETRGFIFDKRMRFSFRNDGELLHYAVGAIIKKYQSDEYLLFRRRLYPEGCYTIPAGHLEKDEPSEIAVIREVYEETKLAIIPSTFELLYEKEIEDRCRRGADYHVWSLYFGECIGDASLSYEGDILGWYRKDEIISLPELTRPTGYFLSKYLGIQLTNIRLESKHF